MKPRWLYIGLIASVAANLFLGGLIVGATIIGHRAAEMRPAAGLRAPLWRAGDDLSPENRQAFRRLLRDSVLANRDQLRQARALRASGLSALEQPNYDANAAIAQMQRGRDLEQQGRARVEADILRFASTLPQDQRSALAGGFRRMGAQKPPARNADPVGQNKP